MIYTRRAMYYETDKMGVIHHSNYIRWFEEARIMLMDEMGFSYKQIEDMGLQIPVLNVNCNYKAMARFDDILCISVWVQSYTGTRLCMAYEIWNQAHTLLYTTGTTAHCFVTQGGKVVALKKAAPQAHALFEAQCRKDNANHE